MVLRGIISLPLKGIYRNILLYTLCNIYIYWMLEIDSTGSIMDGLKNNYTFIFIIAFYILIFKINIFKKN